MCICWISGNPSPQLSEGCAYAGLDLDSVCLKLCSFYTAIPMPMRWINCLAQFTRLQTLDLWHVKYCSGHTDDLVFKDDTLSYLAVLQELRKLVSLTFSNKKATLVVKSAYPAIPGGFIALPTKEPTSVYISNT